MAAELTTIMMMTIMMMVMIEDQDDGSIGNKDGNMASNITSNVFAILWKVSNFDFYVTH